MGEFDDFDLNDSVAETRKKRKEWERREAVRAKLEVEKAAKAVALAQERNRKRTVQVYKKLQALNGRPISDGYELAVVMDSRVPTPAGLASRQDGAEWAVVQAKGNASKPRHRPSAPGQPEFVLAVRCQTEPKYYLEIYPTKRQDRAVHRVTDDLFRLKEWILGEVETR